MNGYTIDTDGYVTIVSSLNLDIEHLQYRVSTEDKFVQKYMFLVPGVKTEDITVMIQASVLKVTVNNREEYPFLWGYERDIWLADNMDTKKITSYIERGILTVEIPYKQESIIYVKEK